MLFDEAPFRPFESCQLVGYNILTVIFYYTADRGVECGNKHFCVCVFVCLSAVMSSGTTRPIFRIFLRVLPVAVDRSSSSGAVIHYIFPSYLHIS